MRRMRNKRNQNLSKKKKKEEKRGKNKKKEIENVRKKDIQVLRDPKVYLGN